MVYKYLGWGITNENGVAKLDHDAQGQEIEHSYTGTGAGEIDVLASLDNPVSSGSIVSEPCNVLDAQFIDMVNGVDNENAIVYSNCTKSVTDGVKLITNTHSTNWSDMIVSTTHESSGYIYFEIPFKVKVVVDELLSDFIFGIQTSGQPTVYSNWNTATGSYEIEVNINGFIVYKDGTELYRKTGNLSSSALVKISMKALQTMKYHDLIIY